MTGPAAAKLDEIRIGTIGPITGWATIFGQGVLNGVKLALEERNNELKGIPIKVFSEDTKADVEVMITKLDSLKNRDKVHLIIGPSLGHEGMAAVDWGARKPGRAHAHRLLRARRHHHAQSHQKRHPPRLDRRSGDLQLRSILRQGIEIQKGHHRGPGLLLSLGPGRRLHPRFLENGGEEVLRIWHPVEAVDFSSIMAKLMELAGQYDAVLNNSGGAQVVAFFKQWKQFGLDQAYPQILGQANVPIVSMLGELGDSALGVYSSLHYYDGNPSEANKKFRESYKKKFGDYPDVIAMQGYDAMRWPSRPWTPLTARWTTWTSSSGLCAR